MHTILAKIVSVIKVPLFLVDKEVSSAFFFFFLILLSFILVLCGFIRSYFIGYHTAKTSCA